MNKTFDPFILAEDLGEVRRIYAQFFSELDAAAWDKPGKGSPKEWTLHETVAHLVALNGAGLESIEHTLRGESYIFIGLDDRYQFNAYNRKGIDHHFDIPINELCAKLLDILDESARFARDLQPDQAKLTARMPIYNRPVSIVEALSIIIFHAGLVHSAQVTEPAGLPPLWMELSSETRHRVIERAMRAFNLLYRLDIGGSLRATLVFRVDGPGGGEWYVNLSPDFQTSGEGFVENPSLVIQLRETAVFCRMVTGRINLPLALVRGEIKLRGDLSLFMRMNTLFSVDARLKGKVQAKTALGHNG